MIGGAGSMYWIEYKLLYILVHIAGPKLIEIKSCWFGLYVSYMDKVWL